MKTTITMLIKYEHHVALFIVIKYDYNSYDVKQVTRTHHSPFNLTEESQ